MMDFNFEEPTALLGSQVGDVYQLHENTAEVLNDMNRRLNEEEKTLRTYRRALAFSQVVQKDLIPILMNCSDRGDVFDSVIRLLVNLSVPIECLCPIDIMSQSTNGMQVIFELKNSLKNTKEAFTDSRSSKSIMEKLSSLTENKAKELCYSDINTINSCLLLIRNILHIPETSARPGKSNLQNQIMWNLFVQNLDKVLLDLISHVNASHWCTVIVQLIALIYKDQHIVNLQKMLQTFIENTLSESSDNESNTSPLHGDSSSQAMDSSEEDSRGQRTTSANSGSDCSSPPIASPHSHNSEEKTEEINLHEETPEEKPEPEKKRESSSGRAMETSSGIESESEPPLKKFIQEENSVIHAKLEPRPEEDFQHKQRFQCIHPISGNSSESSDITGVPKSTKNTCGSNSDFGYVSQQPCVNDIPESNSSSSNEEERRIKRQASRANIVKPKAKNQTTLTHQEKQEKRRLKMLSLSRQQRMRVKAMVNHSPTDEDISELLKEFTVDFILTEYSNLVRELLKLECGRQEGLNLDKSHFLWLITYFLKFASQLDIGLEHMGSVLSFNTIAYITYEGVVQQETLELANRGRKSDMTPHLRRMHLVVTALREFIQTLTAYKQSIYTSEGDERHLFSVQLQISYTKSLRQLMVLLLRTYDSGLHSQQYLSDLVVTNHHILTNIEEISQSEMYQGPRVDLLDHLKQLANADIMRHYGHLLTDFQDNLPLVNDCLFTMMHHVAGDLEAPEVLFIPVVLQTFSRILEQGLNICQDWVDLIEFIIQKFIQTMQIAPQKCAATIADCMDSAEVADECGLTGTQASHLFYNYNQVENHSDPVGAIIEIYRQTDTVTFSRMSIIQALLSHGIITHAQYMNFMYMKSVLAQCKTERDGSVIAEVGSEHCTSDGHITDGEEQQDGIIREHKEIKVLKDCLIKQGKESLIYWVQEVLLDACRVKMYPDSICVENRSVPHEPIYFHYMLAKQSIPLVPFNRVQWQGLQTEAFILLLHKLGFLLPADVGKVYPRIPFFWSADHLYAVASKLGPVKEDPFKFSPEDIERIRRKEDRFSVKSPVGDRPPPEKDCDENHDLAELDLLAGNESSNSNMDSRKWIYMTMASKKMEKPSSQKQKDETDMETEEAPKEKEVEKESVTARCPPGRQDSDPLLEESMDET